MVAVSKECIGLQDVLENVVRSSVYIAYFTLFLHLIALGRALRDFWGDIVLRLSLPPAPVFGTQNNLICAVSSVGRASPRHGGGHWFEPNTAHHL